MAGVFRRRYQAFVHHRRRLVPTLALPAGGGSSVNVWTGSAWEAKPLMRWDGAAWVPAALMRWDGAAWVQQ